MSTLQECDLCQRKVDLNEEPDGIATCGHCERNLCIDCLENMYVKSGVSQSDAAQIREIYGPDGFFRKVEFGEDRNCPDCYDDLSDDGEGE